MHKPENSPQDSLLSNAYINCEFIHKKIMGEKRNLFAGAKLLTQYVAYHTSAYSFSLSQSCKTLRIKKDNQNSFMSMIPRLMLLP